MLSKIVNSRNITSNFRVRRTTSKAFKSIPKASIKDSKTISYVAYIHRIQALKIQKIVSSRIIKIQKIDSGGGTSMSLVFSFGANDLVNGKLKKVHGWNTNEIDVTVIDNIGREIEFGSIVTLTDVEVDLNRATITGTWKLLLEKVG